MIGGGGWLRARVMADPSRSFGVVPFFFWGRKMAFRTECANIYELEAINGKLNMSFPYLYLSNQ